MASAFEGVAQTVPEGKYATTANEMPKFMQDAIYNQIQLAQNIAQTPYEEYTMPQVAELTPDQQQAFANVRANQGMWQPGMQMAQEGMAALTQAPGQAAAAQPYFQQVAGMSGMGAAQPALQQQANLLGGINYNAPTSTLDTRQNQYLNPDLANYALQQAQNAYGTAGTVDIAGAASPYIQRAASMSGLENAQGLMEQQAGLLGSLNYNNPAANLYSAQNQYLNPNLAAGALQLGQTALSRASNLDVGNAAQPYLQQAAQTSAAGINQYMNPYQEGVMNAIASQGARNLSEKLLPAVSDAFIRAGQFGGKRMGEFGERALRDTQEAILNQQAQALQQGYGQALTASQADLARQAQLASTAGQLTGQQQSALTTIGQAQTAAGQAQQQAGLSAAQQVANAQAQALSQAQQSAAQYGQLAGQVGSLTAQQQQTLANLGQTAGQLTGQQAAHLLNVGQAQAAMGQTQQQAGLQAAQNIANAQQQAIGAQMQGASQYGQLGSQLGALTSDQQKILAGLGTSAAGFAAGDINTQMSALSNIASLAQAQQGAAAKDTAALEAIGQAQQGNMQQQLNAAYQQYKEGQQYPMQMADWLSTQVRGMAPITPQMTTQNAGGTTVQYGASPLSQIAGAYATYKGLTG